MPCPCREILRLLGLIVAFYYFHSERVKQVALLSNSLVLKKGLSPQSTFSAISVRSSYCGASSTNRDNSS